MESLLQVRAHTGGLVLPVLAYWHDDTCSSMHVARTYVISHPNESFAPLMHTQERVTRITVHVVDLTPGIGLLFPKLA